MHLSFQKAFYALATLFGLFAILILAKSVLIPIAFALLISFILYPIARKLESWGANEIISAFLAILAVFLIVAGSIVLFSSQIVELSDNLTDFKGKILDVFADVTFFFNKNIGFLPDQEDGAIFNKIKDWLNESAGSLLSTTVGGTAEFFFGLLTAVVFTFLILIYRRGLVRSMVHFYPKDQREKALKMFKSVQTVGKQYLFGMSVIVLILGFVNSIGLWIIGIDSPFLFGFLAALLALIPYAGTFLGAALPIIYAFMSFDSIWMPISIGIFFWFVQFVESNFLTPKIVGGNLKINALTSILCIIIGATVWGIAGMILFLPFTAMLKVMCEEYEELKPVAMLIGEENYTSEETKKTPDNEWIRKIKKWFSNLHGKTKN